MKVTFILKSKQMGQQTLGVFDSTQVKSATGNNGELSKTNPDITKENKSYLK
jgi:hypothetical protein